MGKEAVETATKPTKEAGTEGEAAGSSAPRPRKFDYGIQPENKVSVKALAADADEPKLKSGEDEGYNMAKRGCTVQAFTEKSTRSILRRLSRKGLVTVTSPDGTTFPRDYVAPVKSVKAEAA